MRRSSVPWSNSIRSASLLDMLDAGSLRVRHLECQGVCRRETDADIAHTLLLDKSRGQDLLKTHVATLSKYQHQHRKLPNYYRAAY